MKTLRGISRRIAATACRIHFAPLRFFLLVSLLVVFTPSTPSPVSAAGASNKPFLVMARALKSAFRYRMDIAINTLSSTVAAAPTKMTAIVIRRGTDRELYLTGDLQSVSTGATSDMEMVITGNRVCVRMDPRSDFVCIVSQTDANKIFDDPTQELMKTSLYSAVRPSRSKLVSGVKCAGYAYTYRSPTTHSQGTLYINRTTNLPCEQDDLATVAQGNTTIVGSSVATWTRFNDPTLTIPTVPAD